MGVRETTADLAGDEPDPELPGVRRGMLVALVLLGLAAALGGAFGLRQSWHPRPTAAQLASAERAEAASRWRLLTAGQVFPALVSYVTLAGAHTAARLLGIAPAAPCALATDAAVGDVLARYGCRVVLRATYADASGTLVATVGVAVMPTEVAAEWAFTAAPSDGVGIDAVAEPGTPAAGFGGRQRAYFGSSRRGEYLEFIVAGFADGRVTRAAPGDAGLTDLTGGLLGDLSAGPLLTRPADPCAATDIAC